MFVFYSIHYPQPGKEGLWVQKMRQFDELMKKQPGIIFVSDHLYEKYGFVQEGRITREFYLHGQFVDVYMMGLQLDPPQALPADA